MFIKLRPIDPDRLFTTLPLQWSAAVPTPIDRTLAAITRADDRHSFPANVCHLATRTFPNLPRSAGWLFPCRNLFLHLVLEAIRLQQSCTLKTIIELAQAMYTNDDSIPSFYPNNCPRPGLDTPASQRRDLLDIFIARLKLERDAEASKTPVYTVLRPCWSSAEIIGHIYISHFTTLRRAAASGALSRSPLMARTALGTLTLIDRFAEKPYSFCGRLAHRLHMLHENWYWRTTGWCSYHSSLCSNFLAVPPDRNFRFALWKQRCGV